MPTHKTYSQPDAYESPFFLCRVHAVSDLPCSTNEIDNNTISTGISVRTTRFRFQHMSTAFSRMTKSTALLFPILRRNRLKNSKIVFVFYGFVLKKKIKSTDCGPNNIQRFNIRFVFIALDFKKCARLYVLRQQYSNNIIMTPIIFVRTTRTLRCVREFVYFLCGVHRRIHNGRVNISIDNVPERHVLPLVRSFFLLLYHQTVFSRIINLTSILCCYHSGTNIVKNLKSSPVIFYYYFITVSF